MAKKSKISGGNVVAGKKARIALQTIAAILVCLILFFPLYWMIITSLKTTNEVITTTPSFWPQSLQFSNWAKAWKAVDFPRYIFNTLWVTFWHLLLNLVTGVLAAYGFSRGNFPLKNFLFLIVLSAMSIPGQVTFIPIYLIISKLDWVNTFAGLILPGIVSAYMIFMLRQNFLSVDQSYIDAGKMDGLGIFGTIYHILIPMCKASIITVALNSFINGWNNYFWPKILVRDDAIRPISLAIIKMKQMFDDVSGSGLGDGYYEVAMSGVLISVVPILVLYLLCQKHLLKGYAKNAMK
ncbi:MAG: carbohydrate ABC transporter permease [Lachnospiraceae bacterium]|nr:carbohydrate ABC transporter permease [Lachnospiraceae bacterium]